MATLLSAKQKMVIWSANFLLTPNTKKGGETETATLSEAIDVALTYKDDLDNARTPEEIMYKED